MMQKTSKHIQLYTSNRNDVQQAFDTTRNEAYSTLIETEQEVSRADQLRRVGTKDQKVLVSQAGTESVAGRVEKRIDVVEAEYYARPNGTLGLGTGRIICIG